MTAATMVHDALMLAMLALATGCDSAGYGSKAVAPPQPVLTTVRLSLGAGTLEVGETTTASAVAFDQFGARLAATAVPAFASATPEIAAVNAASGAIVAVAAGTTQISAAIEGKSDRRTLTVVRPPIRINEVNPSGDLPNGWVELYNPTDADVDLEGWTLASGDLVHRFTLPPLAVIPAHGFLAVNEPTLPAGLTSSDGVYLFNRFGGQVDSFGWSDSPSTTFGRCPDGSGAFVVTTAPTRKSVNACPGVEP